ncbi:MAG: B12-binding domain-containing radical SAM protein [Kiloniellales bacterium]|nr:B12-binding domain-containing radical SAM protein [Kiloniellales bacterium]
MDIILINPGARHEIYQDLGNDLTAVEPPLWCRLLAGYLRDRDWGVTIIDAEAEHIGPKAVTERVQGLSPRLVCVVAYGHQPSASTQQMVAAGAACRALKDGDPSLPVILVGGHVSALPEQTLQEEAADYVCVGEGPVTLDALLHQLCDNDPALEAVPGLAWIDEAGGLRRNPGAPLLKDLDADLHGDVWDLLPMERYRAHNWQCFGALERRQPYASIYTSLGCPYKCSFCCINAPFGTNRYRMRSPEAVVAEIRKLHDVYGVKTFKIIDEMFVLNWRHVTGICEALAEAALDINIWAYARIDTVRPDKLDLLRRAGIRWLALGIESGSEHVRDGAEKSFTQDDIFEIVRAIQTAGIHVIGNFIFGLPDDDADSMQATLELAKSLNCEFANFYSAMAYPGSPLYHMALENGWALPETWEGFSQHSYSCKPLPTEHLSAAEVLAFRDQAFHDYFASPRYLDTLTQRFGWETRRHVQEMAKTRLRRQLLEPDSLSA